jgi:nitroimidazol reductase NimA-like FMN-containing flavoprotein (pyridoxamine 5'-phosphate oxidase superfamily)
MQLVKKYEIHSKDKMIDFINGQPVGRIASLDSNGYPQVIPMNFVYHNAGVYMHSHPFGEKLDNIRRNPSVGFEVDQHICFLPSYYFHPKDASQADTLYISVVMKGKAEIVQSNEEKAVALNALMKKYQKEGRYEALDANMPSVHEVAIIKIVPKDMRGKYKIGQHWPQPYRLKMARSIIEREGLENAVPILGMMGIDVTAGGAGLLVKEEPRM